MSDCQRAHATRNRGYRRCDTLRLTWMNISDQCVTAFIQSLQTRRIFAEEADDFLSRVDAICTDIDDHHTFLQEISGNQGRATDRCDQYISPFANFGQVTSS